MVIAEAQFVGTGQHPLLTTPRRSRVVSWNGSFIGCRGDNGTRGSQTTLSPSRIFGAPQTFAPTLQRFALHPGLPGPSLIKIRAAYRH